MTDPVPAAPSPIQRSSRLGVILLAVLLGVWLAYSLSWAVTAKLVQDRVDDWIGLQQSTGLAITTGKPGVGGFPGKIKVTLPGVAAAAPASNGGWTWHASQVTVATWPLMVLHFDLDFAGTHEFTGLVTPATTPLTLTAAQAGGALSLDWHGRLRAATLHVADLSAHLTAVDNPLVQLGQGTATVAAIDAGDGKEGNSPTLPATSRVTIDATDLRLPGWLPAPLDHAIAHAAATLEVTGVAAPGPLPQVLEAWRASGGTVEFRSLELDWPPLKIAGNGSLALDAALQPIGAFSLDVAGGDGAVDSFAAAGWMGKDDVSLAHAGLALMSHTGADGKTEELHVPLTLQNHHLSAGPVTLLTVPAVFWPKVMVP